MSCRTGIHHSLVKYTLRLELGDSHSFEQLHESTPVQDIGGFEILQNHHHTLCQPFRRCFVTATAWTFAVSLLNKLLTAIIHWTSTELVDVLHVICSVRRWRQAFLS
jgi:hypothetical protein